MDPVQAFMQANGLTAPLYPPTSRYYGIASAQLTGPDGSVVTYLKRRFVPPPEHFATLAEHQVVSGDRIDFSRFTRERYVLLNAILESVGN